MGFERCHPAVNFIFFTAVIASSLLFRHPAYLAISYVFAAAYTIKLGRTRAVIFNLVLLPLILLFAIRYSTYHHFGVTVLGQNFIDNNITVESFVYGAVVGFSFAAALLWLYCIWKIITTDKVVYLFGKISPRVSLFLAILLRMIPRLKREAQKINTARCGIGTGSNQGNIWQRLLHIITLISTLITWLIEALGTQSDSMQSRGSMLRGRTAFSIYRFDNRDRAFVIIVFLFLTVTLMAGLLRQTVAFYDPQIIIAPFVPASVIFYFGYAALCFLPMGLDYLTEYLFAKARKKCQ